MSGRSAKGVVSSSWAYLPAASGPIGGGLIKLGHGSTEAAVAVGLAPYAVCGLLFVVFVIGYLAAVSRYLWAKPAQHDAMERLITVSANAVVAILTLTTAAAPPAKPAENSCRATCAATDGSLTADPARDPTRDPIADGAAGQRLRATWVPGRWQLTSCAARAVMISSLTASTVPRPGR
jgi:hypothetical protein